MKQLSTREITKLAELAEAEGTADFFRAAPPGFAEQQGIYLEEAPSYTATLVRNAPEYGMYNGVMALGVAEPATEADLDHLVELYSAGGLPFSVRLSPNARPAELAQWLEARGFTRDNNSARFYRRAKNPPVVATGFRIELVGTEHARDFARIACWGLPEGLQTWLLATVGREGWYHYLVFDGGTSIASGALIRQGELGWLGWAATLPEHRRKGAQSALLAHRIAEAERLGCEWLSVETGEDTPDKSNPSFRNITRVGFQLAYLRPKYVYKPPAHKE